MEFVLQQVFAMTERRFQLARRLIRNKPWDYFMMVEMGPDRLHHVFWQHFDPRHPLYEPGNPFETAFQDYYRFLDKEVGALLEVIPEDAITIVMSDHGARPMMGGLCFNDWLMREGYLAMSEPLAGPTPIAKAPIDWGRTVAWGDGGYYGRLFLNVRDREPQGVVEPSRYEDVRDELIAKLEAAPGPDGQRLGTKVFRPQDVYPDVRGVAPDLIVYFGDLEWRSVGSVGNPSIYTYENDTGPDGANHDRAGVFALSNVPGQRTGQVDGLRLVDVGPSILSLYGIDAPEGAVGKSFL
jgi:predicted AlkP superfamily phosphohydrolase/phosphomutase